VPPKARSRPTLVDFEVAAAAVPPVDDRLVHQVPLAAIRPSPRNPRLALEGIDELATSLSDHGLLQPVVVRRLDEGYELIAGHRRLEAARRLDWLTIAAVERDETRERAYILTLVENLQREDLTPKEEAAALEVLIRERGWSTRQVGEAIKRSPIYVSRRLRVFEDDVLAPLVLNSGLAVSTAEELLRADDLELRRELAEEAARDGWNQTAARHAVAARRNVTLRWQPTATQLAQMLANVESEGINLSERRLLCRLQRAISQLLRPLAISD
jgi:ParB family chromosome partitioning protein